MEELKKQRQTLQEERCLSSQLQTSVARVQFLESSTVARSIVSKQEARICDLENKLEFQRGQVKRFEVSPESDPLTASHFLLFLREDLYSLTEMQVEELSAVRQTLQADLETSIRRIVDLQAALEEVESSDESDTESVQTAVESFSRRKDL
ncbi:hypothetical protein cypCar_00013463 [Cyprinus carpio]|nr:hypothetical protein cypCar_00013463 [Cyprinus carpio]